MALSFAPTVLFAERIYLPNRVIEKGTKKAGLSTI